MNLPSETIADVNKDAVKRREVIYFAMESRYADMFLCEPLGRGLYTEVQLSEWAKRMGVELVLLKKEKGSS